RVAPGEGGEPLVELGPRRARVAERVDEVRDRKRRPLEVGVREQEQRRLVDRANRVDELQRRVGPAVAEWGVGGAGLEERTGLCLVAVCEESPDVVRPLVRKAFGRLQGQE